MNNYDVIVIGAGSVGTPITMSLAKSGMKVLCIDEHASAGQANNKCAIGGIRATHGDPAKVALCLHSLEVFRTWKEKYGEDIGWRQGGYCYVAYDRDTLAIFEKNVPLQQKAGLDISIVSPKRILELVPGLNKDGLLGGTYSPGDGSASPMDSCYAFYRKAVKDGAEFRFTEWVTDIIVENSSVTAVETDKNRYSCNAVVNCGGSAASTIGRMVGLDLPIIPDCHEAGITEPVKRFFEPMLVDIRKAPGSANYYFYQYSTGQVVFCITPDPPILGTDTKETSEFLPLVAPRMVSLYPRLANLKVRRVWRGSYPMTPDGTPIIGRYGPPGHYIAVGMCGQGFMLGPGIGDTMTRLIRNELSETDRMILNEFRLDRKFDTVETLK